MVRFRLPIFLVLLALVLAACAQPTASPTAAPTTAAQVAPTTAPTTAPATVAAATPTTAAAATAATAASPTTAASAAMTPASAMTPSAATTPGGATTPAAAAATTPAPTATPNPNAALQLANDQKLGQILTDPKGMTLYFFKNDKPGVSNCSGTCATNWPPLLAKSGMPEWPAGLPGTLGTINRSDGGTQVTYNGMPLYTFAKDSKPGDTTGQGVSNIWYVAKPGELFVPEGQTAIKVSNDSKLGQILTDSNGWTLYYYTKDAPNTTNCYNQCANNWPPFVIAQGDAKLPDGTIGSLGTVTRTDGTIQVTYNGMPLYYWAKDLKPGDTTGQNVGKVWFVINPSDKAPANFPTSGGSTTAPAAATPAAAETPKPATGAY